MLFTDPLFLFLFLPAFLAVYRHVGARIPRFHDGLKVVLVGGTLIFYCAGRPFSWWAPFVIAVLFDFGWSRALARTESPSRRRLLLTFSIVQNVGLLALYKYLPWVLSFDVLENLAWLSPLRDAWLLPGGRARYEMPAGISFYLFESMSYVIDVYRRTITPPRNPLDFLTFIAMFPRFVAGPIARYGELATQMASWTGTNLPRGLPLFMIGFISKALFADSAAVFVPYAFQHSAPDMFAAWLGVVAFMIQIYFDFSGYSLMAIGLGWCLGFRFATNFKNPYGAHTFSDFWRRWHVTLGAWMRDYVYIPLGGNRVPAWRRDLNLLITMTLVGLWHGANWTFVVWGALIGVGFFLERRLEFWIEGIPPLLYRFIVFLANTLLFTLFNARSVEHALRIGAGLRGDRGFFATSSLDLFIEHRFEAFWLVVASLALLALLPRWTPPEDRETWPRRQQWTIALLFFIALANAMSARAIPFLYFQF